MSTQSIREQVENEIKEAFADGCAFADGYDDKVNGTAMGRTEAILKLFTELIGPMETPEEYMAKHLTEKELSMAVRAAKFHARNEFRRELLDKLGGEKV